MELHYNRDPENKHKYTVQLTVDHSSEKRDYPQLVAELGQILKTEVDTAVGKVPCWKFVSSVPGLEHIIERQLHAVRYKLESRLFGTLVDSLKPSATSNTGPDLG